MLAAVKTCNGCQQELPTTAFIKDRSRPGGYGYRCLECSRKRQRINYHENRSRISESRRQKRKTDPRYFRRGQANWERFNLRKYHLQQVGLTLSEYETLLQKQNGVCKICQQPETRRQRGDVTRLAVDHDHATGQIRGLLCYRCNLMLGYAKDSVTSLLAAVTYLQETQNG